MKEGMTDQFFQSVGSRVGWGVEETVGVGREAGGRGEGVTDGSGRKAGARVTVASGAGGVKAGAGAGVPWLQAVSRSRLHRAMMYLIGYSISTKVKGT